MARRARTLPPVPSPVLLPGLSVGVAVQMGHFDMNDHPSPIFARGYLDLRAQAQAASAGGTEAPPAAGKAAKAKRKKKKTKGRKAKAKAQPKMKTKKAAQ